MMTVAILLVLIICQITTNTSGQLYTDDVSDGRCTLNKVPDNFTSCLPYVTINFLFTKKSTTIANCDECWFFHRFLKTHNHFSYNSPILLMLQ